MSFTITQNCCKDATCISACPVNCIHPSPGEPEFATAPMLYIDARACIDCGACADACPVDAARPSDELTGPERVYVQINERFYDGTPVPERVGPLFRTWTPPTFDWSLPSDFAGLNVAIVGTGPAGLYAAELLVLHTDSTVTLIDRLPVAGGLVRYGVAPDHPGTKRVGHAFSRLYSHPRVTVALGVEVGRDVTVEQLAEQFDAVIYAVGVSVGRRLDVPGEQLPGVLTGPEFVGWYNAHPDLAADAVQLAGVERAVVVGTGNVALDVARILAVNTADLAGTDIADHALDALRTSAIREVVVLGRRGPEDAAYTEPELLALTQLPGVEVVVDADEADLDAGPHARLLTHLPRRPSGHADRIVTLKFRSELAEITGGDRVTGVTLTDGTTIDAGLVVTSIGYHGVPIPGLPFDAFTGTAPNDAGRVRGATDTYVVGWYKRGSAGGIGDNRVDAQQTVRTLLDDAVAGRITRVKGRRFAPSRVVDGKGMLRILEREHAAGESVGRVAVKFSTRDQLIRASRG